MGNEDKCNYKMQTFKLEKNFRLSAQRTVRN